MPVRRKKAYWEEVLDYFAGTELHDYLEKIANKRLTTAIKPQYVDKLSKVYSGRVRDLLTKIDRRDDAQGCRHLFLRRAFVLPRHLPATPGREGHSVPLEGEVRRRRGARSRGPRLSRRHRLPDVRRGGRVRDHRATAARPYCGQRLPGRVSEGREHPLPRPRDPVRHPAPARRLEGRDAGHVRRAHEAVRGLRALGPTRPPPQGGGRRRGRAERDRQDDVREDARRPRSADERIRRGEMAGVLQAAVPRGGVRGHGR